MLCDEPDFRAMKKEDIDKVTALFRNVYEEVLGRQEPQLVISIIASNVSARQFVDGLLREKSSMTLVLEINGQIVSAATYSPPREPDDLAELENFVTYPVRKGYGSAMIGLIEGCANQDARGLSLVSHPSATKFYEQKGYSNTKQTLKYPTITNAIAECPLMAKHF